MSTSDLSSRITEALTPVLDENVALKESIEEIRAMMAYEDRSWMQLFGAGGANRVEGLDLDQVKDISEKARKKVAGSSLPKRAADLHAGYVFGNNLEISGTERNPDKKGPPLATVRFYENSVNQESIFSGAAKRELQYSRFTDGNVIVFCDTGAKTVRRIPISEIEDVMVNPDHHDEIWAWLRKWNRIGSTGESEQRREWVYSNRYPENKKKSISWGGESVPVRQNTIAVDLRSNRQVGWTFGIGDALAGLHWAEAYGEVLRYGQIVNESLAKIIFKVISKTPKGAKDVGVKMGGSGFGQGAAVGEGQDIQLVNSSQRSFDFTAARPLAAMAATAWNVSNIDLLADSSAAGSSYGAAQSLTEGVRNAMNAMREEWTQFYQDIYHAFGFDRPQITWPPMEQPDAYRLAQELTLYAPALSDEEYRAEVLDRLNIAGNAKDIPPSLAARSTPPKQAASPDQGQNSPAGSADSTSKNDERTDTQTEVLRQIHNEDFLRKMQGIVERMEKAAGQK